MHEEVGLVGREAEWARLVGFLDGSGTGALALSGDAGVGKSALSARLCELAVQRGWQVLRAVGVEAEKSFTLGGLNQIAFGLRDRESELAPHDRGVLSAVFGADPATPPGPMRLVVAMVNLLTLAAAERPLLLAVDDVHWFDDLSATVLGAVGRRVSDPRLRILATFRAHPGAPFATAGWAQLTLGPLGGADAAAIVDGTGLPLSPDARQRILDVAGGNPLALQELPRHADQIDAHSYALPLTDRLLSVFGGRLDQLEPRVRTELLRAALDGTHSRYPLHDAQAGIDAGLLIVDPLGDIVFRHPLARAAVIHQASAEQRRDAHRHLAGLYDDVVRRATHLSAAATVPDQAVADLLEQAARHSIRRGGAAVAVDWLRRAAELSTAPARRAELLSDAAFVASQSSRFDEAQSLTEAAGGQPVSAVLTGAYLALYRDGEVTAGHRRLLAALRDAEAITDEALTRLVNLLLALTQYAADAELWGGTLDALDRLGDRLTAESAIYRDAWGDVARTGRTVRARLAAHVERLPTLEPWEVMRLAVAAYYVDGLADFRATVRSVLERERDRGAVTNAMTMQHLVFLDAFANGRWDDAAATGQEGLRLTEIHHNELFRYQFTGYLGMLAACRGDLEAARTAAATVLAWASPRRLGLLIGYAQRTTVLAALAEGDYEAAYAAAVTIGAPGAFPPYAYQAVDGLLDLVDAAVHTGRQEQARVHAQAAVRLGLAEVSPRLEAVTTAAAAMTAPDDEAAALFSATLAHPAMASVPFEEARIRLAYGMWLRRQRRATEARVELSLAADGFESLGARPWAARARAELRAAGANVKRGQAALSAQERTIAELAAAGHSNKQIAAQLYLSPRTVGAHLYRIFPKLGITSRAGLAVALREYEAP